MPIQTAVSILTNIPAPALLGPLLLIHLAFLVKFWPEKPRSRSGWSVEDAGDLDLGLSWRPTGLTRPKKGLKATEEASVQVKDSISERTTMELSESLAKATESLSQHQQELTLKDLHITALTGTRRELETLCSEMQGKSEKYEKRIAELTVRLANLEEECASKDAQIVRMTKKGEELEMNITSMKEMIAFQERSLLLLEETSKNQGNHNQTLSEILKNQQKLLAENEVVVAELNAKLTEQTSKADSMAQRISSLAEECQSLEETCESLTNAAAQDEETIAHLKVNLAQETAAAGDWKDLYVQSLSQPHQPRVRMQTDAPVSSLSIQEIIAEKDRRIAELIDRFTECYGQLVASQAGNWVGRSLLQPPEESSADNCTNPSKSKAVFPNSSAPNTILPFASALNSLAPNPFSSLPGSFAPNPFLPNPASTSAQNPFPSVPNSFAPNPLSSGPNPNFPAASGARVTAPATY